MALVIAFVPDPAKAVAEMVRVVRPGGTVCAYMWDVLGGGSPTTPIHRAMQAMGLPTSLPPTAEASRRQAMKDHWVAAGLQSVETEVMHITVSYADFDDFWGSFNVPSGPQGLVIQALTPEKREELRQTLKSQASVDGDGRVAYGAFANAVKGRVAG